MGKKVYKIENAVILAAGRGTRIRGSFNKPKCLIKFQNKSLLDHSLEKIHSFSKKIFIITGYKHKEIKIQKKTNIQKIFFPNYKNTNNLQTLLYIKKYLNQSFLCLFADLIYEKKIIKKILSVKNDFVLAVNTKSRLKDTMRVKIKNNRITEIGNKIKPEESDGNFLGIAKFSNYGAKNLKKYLIKNKNNTHDYYTEVLNQMIKDNFKIKFVDVSEAKWIEIDSIKDYKKLNEQFKI